MPRWIDKIPENIKRGLIRRRCIFGPIARWFEIYVTAPHWRRHQLGSRWKFDTLSDFRAMHRWPSRYALPHALKKNYSHIASLACIFKKKTKISRHHHRYPLHAGHVKNDMMGPTRGFLLIHAALSHDSVIFCYTYAKTSHRSLSYLIGFLAFSAAPRARFSDMALLIFAPWRFQHWLCRLAAINLMCPFIFFFISSLAALYFLYCSNAFISRMDRTSRNRFHTWINCIPYSIDLP